MSLNGEIRCAQTQCPQLKCRPNENLVAIEGQCCAKCVETPGVCTVFGPQIHITKHLMESSVSVFKVRLASINSQLIV